LGYNKNMNEQQPRATITREVSAYLMLIGIFFLVLVISFFELAPVPEWVLLLLSLVGLIPVLESAVRAIISGDLTVDLLASVALIASLLSGEWYSAIFVNLMLLAAKVFDSWTEARAKTVITKLLKYRPNTVRVKRGDEIVQIPLSDVVLGEHVLVGIGERIPVDGTIVSGDGTIDESTLTGESMPITKKMGESVFESTLLRSGAIVVRMDRSGKDSTVSRIIALVDEATRTRAPIERIANIFTRWYLLISFGSAILIYLFSHNLDLVLAVLLVVCADDIAVAIPFAFTAGIARAAEFGVVVKGSAVLEALPRVTTFLTDKTGTLTSGVPLVQELKIFGKHSEEELFALAASAESQSAHPFAQAIINAAKKRGIQISSSESFSETPGQGVRAEKGDLKVMVGAHHFLEGAGVIFPQETHSFLKRCEEEGQTAVCMSIEDTLAGVFVLADMVKPEAMQSIKMMRNFGIKKWVMLTGDNERVARRVADQAGIDEVAARLTPEKKLEVVRMEKKKAAAEKHGALVAMMGDGVNDAAALAQADVSIAMGVIGSDVSIEAADIALMKDDISRIPDLLALAQTLRSVINLNFGIWAVTNIVGLTLVFKGVIGPAGAAAYNFATDFIPIANAFRVLAFKPQSAKLFLKKR
jgi:Cu+-exporting ATPase